MLQSDFYRIPPPWQAPTPSVDELVEALRRAERRGYLGRVRKLQEILEHLGLSITTHSLASSAGGRQ